jgi:hypothetical protein
MAQLRQARPSSLPAQLQEGWLLAARQRSVQLQSAQRQAAQQRSAPRPAEPALSLARLQEQELEQQG